MPRFRDPGLVFKLGYVFAIYFAFIFVFLLLSGVFGSVFVKYLIIAILGSFTIFLFYRAYVSFSMSISGEGKGEDKMFGEDAVLALAFLVIVAVYFIGNRGSGIILHDLFVVSTTCFAFGAGTVLGRTRLQKVILVAIPVFMYAINWPPPLVFLQWLGTFGFYAFVLWPLFYLLPLASVITVAAILRAKEIIGFLSTRS